MEIMQPVLDSLWIIISAALVFFMHAGFALVESGFCRRKNVVMILLKNVTVVAVASLLFYFIGFGIMFGEGNGFMGWTLFSPGVHDGVGVTPPGVPLFVFLFFQMVFAATAATIVSGAVAERVKLWPFLMFVVTATAVIYPIVGHWVWGGGFLASWGFHDFAGSTVVHAVGGGMALAGVVVVGPRLGRYDASGRPRPMPAHNLPLATLGVLILWLGWFGFNGGSTLSANPLAIGSVILVTNLSASAGFLAALLHIRARAKSLDLTMALNGALAGLVAITAGADVIGPLDAILVGVIAGILVIEGVFLLDRFCLDDPVGAIAVHGICGIFGTMAVGLFANTEEVRGLFHGGGISFLLVQIAGAYLGFGFAFFVGLLTWLKMKYLMGVRVPNDDEIIGLDKAECGIEAYGGDPDTLGAHGA
jgi:ammonium transporter, Amt family